MTIQKTLTLTWRQEDKSRKRCFPSGSPPATAARRAVADLFTLRTHPLLHLADQFEMFSVCLPTFYCNCWSNWRCSPSAGPTLTATISATGWTLVYTGKSNSVEAVESHNVRCTVNTALVDWSRRTALSQLRLTSH